jgi:hypothetical protein
VTEATEAGSDIDSTVVESFLQFLLKGLRAAQLYLPNNPVYQTAMQNVRKAFEPLWQEMDELQLAVVEHELKWEGKVVLSQPRNESLAWLLFKDGVRTLRLTRGVEDDEVVRLLQVINKARSLPPEADDDLLTMLWGQEFQFITYQYVEMAADNAVQMAKPEDEAPQELETTPRQAAEEPEPERPSGVVRLEDFDSTLYFLDDKDIQYLKGEIDREYQQDLRGNILAILFDIFELQPFPTVRAEIVSIVENFLPYLLAVGDFRTVAYVLREIGVLLDRAREVLPDHRGALEGFRARLSQPETLAQLLQTLDEAPVHPAEDDLGELFRELRGEALETVLEWMPRLKNDQIRTILAAAVQRTAAAYPDQLAAALGNENPAVVLETARLAGRLKLPPLVPALGGLLIRDVGPDVKVAAVEALAAIATPGAMQQLERAIQDANRDIRIAAVRVLGARGHRAALPRIEGVVLGRDLKGGDLTEKMVFFEAYGLLSGPEAIKHLKPMLAVGGGFMRKKQDPAIRACAAMALGKIRAPEARTALEEAATAEKDPLVRNAITKALRERAP